MYTLIDSTSTQPFTGNVSQCSFYSNLVHVFLSVPSKLLLLFAITERL